MLTVLVALAANALVAVLKSIVAVVTGSASMVAEAAHSWADTGNEVFLFIAERRAKTPADTLHPLGYGREAYVWSMIAAFGLFTVGSAVSILHGVQSLSALETEASYGWAYAVLGAAFVLEGISFTQARRETVAGARQAQMSRFEFLESTSNPTLRAVYFEDAAALVGLVIAGLGMWLHQITGNPVYDAIGSILVGVLLGVVAIWLIARNMAFLNGQVADGRPYEAALRWLLAPPGGRRGHLPPPRIRRPRHGLRHRLGRSRRRRLRVPGRTRAAAARGRPAGAPQCRLRGDVARGARRRAAAS